MLSEGGARGWHNYPPRYYLDRRRDRELTDLYPTTSLLVVFVAVLLLVSEDLRAVL